jgi:hypothetical protein
VSRNRANCWLRNPVFGALLLVSLLYRGLIPVGYMPSPDGVVGMVMCRTIAATDAPAASPVASAEGTRTGEDTKRNHVAEVPCPFAAAMSPGVLPTLVRLVAAAPAPPDRPAARPFRPFTGPVSPAHLARGPPISQA